LIAGIALLFGACAPSAPIPTAPSSAATAEPQATSSTSTTPQDDWGEVVIKKGDTIKLGFSAALVGDLAAYGLDAQRGAQLAVDELGKEVFPGYSVELVSEDDQCTGAGGTTVANKVASNPQIVGLIGPMCSGGVIAASDILENAHVVIVAPSATAVVVTARGLEVVNQAVYNDAIQSNALATYVLEDLNLDKAAVLHDGTIYGQGLADVFKTAFEQGGGTVTNYEAITPGETDFRATLTKVAANDPEVIFYGGYHVEGILLVSQKNEVGMEDVVFVGADGINNPKFLEGAGPDAEGVYASSATTRQGAKYEEFVEKYEGAGGKKEDIIFAPQNYDAVAILINALKQAGKLDADGNLVIGRHALAQAVRATKGLAGYSGEITFDDKGSLINPNADVAIFQAKDGQWEPISDTK
jgi:branched-chain amino acid transport system substrate-binding protein